MKKSIIVLTVAFTAAAAFSRPGAWRPRVAPHHYGPGARGDAIALGVLGGAIVGGIIHEAVRPTPAPVVVQQPVVVQPQPTVIVQPQVVTPTVVQQPVVLAPGAAQVIGPQPAVVQQPVYETQSVWVEGSYVDQVQPNGTTVRVWKPGHYESRQVQVR